MRPWAEDQAGICKAVLVAVGYEPKKKPRRVIVSFARALVERAADRQLDIPAPRQCRIDGEIDIDLAKQHRRAVAGLEPHARYPILDREGHRHRRTRPELPMSPAGGQQIERKASTKIHHGYDRPVLGLQYLAPAAPKMPAGQADGGGERDAPDHEEPRSPKRKLSAVACQRPLPLRVFGRLPVTGVMEGA